MDDSLMIVYLGLEAHLVVEDDDELSPEPSSDLLIAVAVVLFCVVACAYECFIVALFKLEFEHTRFLRAVVSLQRDILI